MNVAHQSDFTDVHIKHAVNDFLEEYYGVGIREIYSKLRSTLVENVEGTFCNLCKGFEFFPMGERDKFGLPVKTAMCRNCGLLCINPRPSAAAYKKHYMQGGARDSVYHRKLDFDAVDELLKAYYGPTFVMDDAARSAMSKFIGDRGIQNRAFDNDHIDAGKPSTSLDHQSAPCEPKLNIYARQLYEELKHLIPRNGKVFEVGASKGKQLEPWKVLHGCEVSGIEPKMEAVLQAKHRRGLDLLNGFSDDARIPDNAFDLVLNVNTINHMLDPLGDLRHSWRWLKPDAVLFVDVQDVVEEANYFAFEDSLVEIDHCYMFSLKTLTAMLQKAGFRIERTWVCDLAAVMPWQPMAFKNRHARIIARKSMSPVAIDWPNPTEELHAIMRGQLLWDRERRARLEQFEKKYENLRKRYDDLGKRYDDLGSKYNAVVMKYRALPKSTWEWLAELGMRIPRKWSS